MFSIQIKSYFLFLTFIVLWNKSYTARILMVSPQEVYSHYHIIERIMKELVIRRHNVTMITPYQMKTSIKNYRHIQLTGISEETKMTRTFPKQEIPNFFHLGEGSIWQHSYIITNYMPTVTEKALNQKCVQDLLKNKNEHFDLIILSSFHTEAFYGLAHKYNAPVVVYSPLASSIWINHLAGNPAPSTYVPDFYTSFSGEMTFLERTYNSIFNLWQEFYRKYIYFPKIEKTLHKYFPDAPPIYDLMYNRTAMILVNSHPTLSNLVPRVPAMVDIGGLHVEDPKPLPNDLQHFMDNASNGVILFSLGSNVKSAHLSNTLKKHILKAFSRLKQTVIWKFEDDSLHGIPSNLRIMKWCPQNDIVGHPNMKLLITQGGLLSLAEAVYHAVPIIGIPIFADQKMNMATASYKGYGALIPFMEVNEDRLYNTIQEVISNPKYKNNIQRASQVCIYSYLPNLAILMNTSLLSQVFRSQPMKPLDSAIFWIEHVIKYREAKHFRSTALDLKWYQLYSLDIICFVSICIISVFYFIYVVLKNTIFLKLNIMKHKTE